MILGKKAAVLSENTDYAQGLRRVFKQSFSDQNGTIAEDQTYNPEETEFRTQILKIKNAILFLIPLAASFKVISISYLRSDPRFL